MPSSRAMVRLVALLAPLVLAACAGTPSRAPLVPEMVSVDTVASVIAPQEVLQLTIGNIDVSGKPVPDLWQRMRNGFAIPELTNEAAQERTTFYAARPEYLRRSLERARPFLFMILEEIERRGMPTELALLPLVESAYNPRAVSPAQAAGMWQFIPSTGKRYNLQQDWWRDDRRDILASTNAALDYLQSLYVMFNDWQLALAAYNWGEGAVARAIEKARARGEPTDYANLRMPAETAGYVPKLQAIKNIVMRPELFSVRLPDVPNEPYLATITKTRDIDVKVAARLAEMPVEEFMALNPSHNRPVIPGANRPTIVIPADKLDTFKQNLEINQDKPLSSWQAYLVKAGEKLDRIAARFGIDLASLKVINGLTGRSHVGAGHTLLVPRQDADKESALPVNIAQPAAQAEERAMRVTHTVGKGETLFAVARRFKVAVADIKRWNHLSGNAVRTGQKLTLEAQVAALATVRGPATHKVAGKVAKKSQVAKTSGARKVASAKGGRAAKNRARVVRVASQ